MEESKTPQLVQELLLLGGLYMVAPFLDSQLAFVAGLPQAQGGHDGSVITRILAGLLPLWLHTRRVQGRPPLYRRFSSQVAAGLVLCVILLLAGQGTLNLLALVLPSIDNPILTGIQQGTFSWSALAWLSLTLVSAAFQEEALYRVWFLDLLVDLGITKPVVLIAGALVFAFGHISQGISGVLVSGVLGLMLAGAWLRTRSLVLLVTAHGTYNLWVLTELLS